MKSLKTFMKEAKEISEELYLDDAVAESINQKIGKFVTLESKKVPQLLENWTKHFRKFDANFPDLNRSVMCLHLEDKEFLVKFGAFSNNLEIAIENVDDTKVRIRGLIK